tara:strand:- start:779 stop:1423 length:645 start_codon:yes stop_codon:yes gene_type:complete
MDALSIILTCLIGYLMGTIQPAYFLGKMKGIDIREHGSKNAGAANTSMTLGWSLGFLTALLDILKATVAVHLVRCLVVCEPFNLLCPESYTFLPFLGGAMAVIGHNYPFYMKFKGGKGTASAMGLMLGYDPMWGLIMILTLFLSTIITNYLVIGTVNIYLVMMYRAIFEYPSTEIIITSLFLMALGLYKHRKNFLGIMNGTEKTFRGEWNKNKD